jgi:nucleolar complex protein 3
MPHGRPAKRRRLTPPLDDNATSETVMASDLFHRAADWDLEQSYEQISRQKKGKESTKLPIKTVEGKVERIQEKDPSDDESESFLGSISEDDKGHETPPTDEPDESPAIPRREQIFAAKEELAKIAGLISEDPEEHAGSFKKLAQVGDARSHSSIQKLALATQVAVYKDVIPGYRIRAYKDEDLSTKVSKEVRSTRQYEQALVSGYQGFIKRLTTIAKSRPLNDGQASLRTVAINCACALLLSVPHFNFRSELLSIIVRDLSAREYTPEFSKCIETIQKFFADDDDGAPSLEAVTLLTKMMKAKDYRIREEVLNTFFSLRLLSELSGNSSAVNSENQGRLSKLHGRKVKKEKWEHRSKKERKVARERKAVEKEFKEADATVSYEEREKIQSETLKLVFVSYFRILKARTPGLMGAVLEGLAKYAHLINQDLFGDILEALKDIINQLDASNGAEEIEESDFADAAESRNQTRESLLSTQTAFTLLSGQDVSKSASALHLDLSFFTSHIYRTLYPLALDPDIELGPKSLRLPDPHSPNTKPNAVNISTPVLLLTRVLTSILLTPSQPPPTLTAAAFYKRLLTASLQVPEKSVLAFLNLMNKLAEKHGRKIEPLWFSDERKGDGIFRGESDSVEGTNVLAVGSGVWEEELLRKHYCPQVREGVVAIDKIVAGLQR